MSQATSKAGPGANSGSSGGSTPTLADALSLSVSPREARRLALRVCEAVATMHARGEAHGALSPGAFELARKGGVRILDDNGDSAITRLRYAAPEVARREEATAASDVFALSLIVRELFEGTPARRGDAEELAIEAVDGRVTPPHGLDDQLTSLAALAASPHQETRPRAAEFVAALEESRGFQGFSRQDWVVMALAIVSVVVLVVMLRSSSRDHDRTHQQYLDARAAFEGFLDGLYPELDRVEDIAPFAEAGKRALASMETMLDEERDEADRVLYARTLLWNGRAQKVLGNVEEAKALFDSAAQRAQELKDESIAVQIDLDASIALGEMAKDAVQFEEARMHLGKARQLGDARLEMAPDDADARIALAHALEALGDVTMSTGLGSADRALSVFRTAREVLEHPSLEERSQSREVLEIKANLDRMASAMAWAKGQRGSAIELMRSHVEQAQLLAEMDPGRSRRRQVLARGADALAGIEREAGRLLDSVESYRLSVESWRLLRAMEPEEPRWRARWARTTRSLARVLAETGEWQEAAALQKMSIDELDLMLALKQVPTRTFVDIGEQRLEAATGLLYAGNLAAAREQLDEGRSRLERGPSAGRHATQLAKAKAASDVIEAELLLAEGRWQKAEAAALAFIDRVQDLAIEGNDLELRKERARALLVSSAVRAMDGQVDIATGARERAIAIAEELIRENPTDYGAVALRARAEFVLGRDQDAAKSLTFLDKVGYRGLELSAVRAATAALRR